MPKPIENSPHPHPHPPKQLYKLIPPSEQHNCHSIRPEYLHSFTYNDHISNTAMSMLQGDETSTAKDMRYSDSGRLCLNDASCVRMQESFYLMRSTRKFHAKAIRERNYRFGRRKGEGTGDGDETVIVGSLWKDKVDSYRRKKQQQKQQFSKDKSILSKILQPQPQQPQSQPPNPSQARLTFPRFEPSKHSTSHSLAREVSFSKQKRNRKAKDREKDGGKENFSFYDETEKEAMLDVDSELRYRVRKNGEFLVTPDINRRLRATNNGSIRSKESKQPVEKQTGSGKRLARKSQKYFHLQDLHLYSFKPANPPTLPSPSPQPPQSHPHPLLQSIAQNTFFRVQIELDENPNLLLTKQPNNGNNLLHICVMNNRDEMFEMIVRKCREARVDLLAERNRYGRTPVELGRVLGFFGGGRGGGLGRLVQEVERDRIRGVFGLLGDVFSHQGQ